MKISLCSFALLLLLCIVTTTLADICTIKTVDDFKTLAENAKKQDFDCDIVLENDLNLASVTTNLPLGFISDLSCIPYIGTFDGQGHTIKNLKVTGRTYSGLFCDVNGAVIKNVHIDDSCEFTGTFVGGISVNMSGSITIEHVNMSATLTVNSIGGGLLGLTERKNDLSVIIEDSLFDFLMSQYCQSLSYLFLLFSFIHGIVFFPCFFKLFYCIIAIHVF